MISDLSELVWIAPLAAVAVCITFSACVVGATRSSDARRDGRGGTASAWFALALLAAAATLAGVGAGISVIVAG